MVPSPPEIVLLSDGPALDARRSGRPGLLEFRDSVSAGVTAARPSVLADLAGLILSLARDSIGSSIKVSGGTQENLLMGGTESLSP